MVGVLDSLFPGLTTSSYQLTSPATRNYNCIAWALSDVERWWWPTVNPADDAVYWPRGIPVEETLDAFAAAFVTAGFQPCLDEVLESGFERIALFAKTDVPTHAARQLPNGRWTSKLGFAEDIEHDLRAVEGDIYGVAVRFFKRQIS